MGAVLAKFRKEKSSAEILEKLETEISTIEKYSLKTQEKQRRLVGNFLAISIGLYAIGFLFIFLWFPKSWPDRIIYAIPLFAFPMIIFLVRRLLAWYFQRKITKNSTKLVKLRAEKKKILEEVMEKETYNVASKLLSKYGGDKSYGIKSLSANAPAQQPNKTQTTTDIQIKNLSSSLSSLPTRPGGGVETSRKFGSQLSINQSLLSAAANSGQSTISPMTPRPMMATTPQHPGSALRYRGAITTPSSNTLALQKNLPYPIINQKAQGMLEKLVDYLIGDGPQNRFALICKECSAHNGMAREEDFDYTTYRCAFCNALNPSRKSRPVAPKITSATAPRNISFISRRNSSSSESSDDSDVPRRMENVTSPQPTIEKKEEFESENNNKYSNTNGSSMPTEAKEDESTQNDDTEEMSPSIANDNDDEDKETTENDKLIKESETK